MLRYLRRLCLIGLSCLSLLLPRVAAAHAVLVQSAPQAHAVVAGPATTIELKYNSRVDAEHSSILLIAVGGKATPLAPTQSAPGTLTARAEQLAKGSYVIRWQVLSADGHVTRGEIPFEVK